MEPHPSRRGLVSLAKWQGAGEFRRRSGRRDISGRPCEAAFLTERRLCGFVIMLSTVACHRHEDEMRAASAPCD